MPPNILVFMTDQQRWDTTLPTHPCRTPHLDRLAAQGISFERCYTTAAHCCPARASMMTGLMPSGHGIRNNVANAAALSTSLKQGVVTWSQRLCDAGYRLGYSGKWHVSGEHTPADCGWSEIGPIGARRRGEPVPPGVREHPGLLEPVPRPDPRPEGVHLNNGWPPRPFIGSDENFGRNHVDRQSLEAGLEGIKQFASGDKPWCVMMSLNGPHDPFIVPEPYASLYDPDDIPLPPSFDDRLCDKPNIYRRHREELWDQFTPREYRLAIARYWGCCTMLDDWLGETLATLEATGQRDNTLIVFLSDHGEMLGDHGLFLKGIMAFDEAHHVPLIMSLPSQIKDPGRRVGDLVCLSDFAPTIVDVAEADDLVAVHGRSLRPYFEHKTHSQARRVHYNQMDGVELYYTQRTVRTPRYRYTFNGFDFDELYDLEHDPHEMVNLRTDSRYQTVLREMTRLMWQEADRTDDYIGCPYTSVALPNPGPICRLEPGHFPDHIPVQKDLSPTHA